MIRRHGALRGLLIILTLTVTLTSSGFGALQPAKGMFLVADREMKDPRFRDRVILLVQHDDGGSAGLIVNRISRLSLSVVLSEQSPLNRYGRSLSYGGPVDPETLLALVRVQQVPPEPADKILANLYLTGIGVLDEWPDLSEEMIDFRAFTGYTGWAPGQLNLEMQRGDWRVVPADEDRIFSGSTEQLWRDLMRDDAARE